ncbi:MAG: hypothetical protein ACE5IA_03115 [Dehalococcoidia bacterium]
MNPVTPLFGFILGMEHALEPDHLAVAGVVSQRRNPWRSAASCLFWGLGHSSILVVLGLAVLLLGLSLPPWMDTFAQFAVGGTLVLLGMVLGWRLVRHPARNRNQAIPAPEFHMNVMGNWGFFLIGNLHGLAGGGTLMLLIVSTINSLASGFLFLSLFALSSVLGVILVAVALTVPYRVRAFRLKGLHAGMASLVSLFSVFLGASMMWTSVTAGLLFESARLPLFPAG